jgi:hypothetical protein
MNRRIFRRAATASLSTILLVQTAIAQVAPAPDDATPFPAGTPASSIDPGFVVTPETGFSDPGFIATIEDRSNDAGFIAGGGTRILVPPPPTTPASPAAPVALPLGAP